MHQFWGESRRCVKFLQCAVVMETIVTEWKRRGLDWPGVIAWELLRFTGGLFMATRLILSVFNGNCGCVLTCWLQTSRDDLPKSNQASSTNWCFTNSHSPENRGIWKTGISEVKSSQIMEWFTKRLKDWKDQEKKHLSNVCFRMKVFYVPDVYHVSKNTAEWAEKPK